MYRGLQEVDEFNKIFHSSKIYEEDRAKHRTVETKPWLVSIVISGKSDWWPSNAAALSPSSG